jgi:hypothetical protein
MFKNVFENGAVYEIMCKNMVERGMPRMKMWRMRIACLVSEATDTKYVFTYVRLTQHTYKYINPI